MKQKGVKKKGRNRESEEKRKKQKSKEDQEQRFMISGVEGPHQPKNFVLLEQREKVDALKEYGFNSGYGWTTRSPHIQLSASTVPGKSEEFDTCRSSSKRDESFITKGFINWKDACASFR